VLWPSRCRHYSRLRSRIYNATMPRLRAVIATARLLLASQLQLRHRGLRLFYYFLHPPLREAPSSRLPRHDVFSCHRTTLQGCIPSCQTHTGVRLKILYLPERTK
jgi:hypothetical protein